LRSETTREVVEQDSHAIKDIDVGGDLVVAPAHVLHERMPGRDCAQGSDRFYPAHRPQTRPEPPMISFHDVVRVLLEHMPRRRDKLVEHPRVDRCRSVVTSAGDAPWATARAKNARAADASRRSQTSTSIT
jgi:hypothetical protein